MITNQEMRRKVANIKKTYVNNQTIVGVDYLCIRYLFQHHPNLEKKLEGYLVVRFFLGIEQKHQTRCFFFERSDGKIDDFIANKCMKAFAKNKRTIRQRVRSFFIRTRSSLFIRILSSLKGN